MINDSSVEFLQISSVISDDCIDDECLDEIISERVRQLKVMCTQGIKIKPLCLLERALVMAEEKGIRFN
jgi:hypothetical protein